MFVAARYFGCYNNTHGIAANFAEARRDAMLLGTCELFSWGTAIVSPKSTHNAPVLFPTGTGTGTLLTINNLLFCS